MRAPSSGNLLVKALCTQSNELNPLTILAHATTITFSVCPQLAALQMIQMRGLGTTSHFKMRTCWLLRREAIHKATTPAAITFDHFICQRDRVNVRSADVHPAIP